MDNILDLNSFAILTDSKTSALSPLWEIAIKVEFCSIVSGEKGNSLAITVFIRIFVNLDNRYFITSAAL